ncbi:MAG: glycosyltransferase family 4 protein [Psychroserpens sp.]|uniref:glycosyltransferase family 4 protein n=1 Tax=Psychroserpens sp. TaxID=2020870 RepID=UPI00300275F4
MKVGIVLSVAPSYSETFFISKIKGLMNSGFEVILFVQKNESKFSVCQVVEAPKVSANNFVWQFLKVCYILIVFLIRFPKRFLKFVKLEREINRPWVQIVKNLYNNHHLLKSHLDWVHFGFTTLAIQTEHVPKTIGAKMAVSFRGYDLVLSPREDEDYYLNVWKNVDQVHSISNYLLQLAYKLKLPQNTPHKIIRPAIDHFRFKNETVKSFEKIQFLTVARLHWIKGLKDTLEALHIIKNNGIKFKYTIIGDGPERNELEALIKKLELSKYIKLVGKKSHSDVIKYFNDSNYYLQYSESEGFCNAVLEAQAMGLLCIVSNGGALPENVLNESTGWIVPRKQPETLAKTISKVLNLPKETKEVVSLNAQLRVCNEFNLLAQQEQFKFFYNQNF